MDIEDNIKVLVNKPGLEFLVQLQIKEKIYIEKVCQQQEIKRKYKKK